MSARARAVRRRSKPPLVIRLRPFWVLGALAACVLGVLAFAIVNAPQLRVRSVVATVPPHGPVTQADVIAAAAVDPAANLWLLNTGAIRRRLEAIPYVATASVGRAQFPHPTVRLGVTLRVPTGCVALPAGVVTIDATARVLQIGCAARTLPLVAAGTAAAVEPGATLSAPDIDRLLADAKTIAAQLPVRIVRRDRFGGIEAVDTHGVTIRFGSDADLAAKLALVEPVRRGAGRRITGIDLRAPATPVVEFP